MQFEQGPYLKAALLCERVLREADGVLTLVRIVDRVIHTAVGPDAPTEMPPVSYPLTAVVILTSGTALGRHSIRIVPELPSGIQLEPVETTVQLEGQDRGANIIMNINMTFQMEGLYWFNVYIEDKLVTKIPLRLMYSRMTTGRPRA